MTLLHYVVIKRDGVVGMLNHRTETMSLKMLYTLDGPEWNAAFQVRQEAT